MKGTRKIPPRQKRGRRPKQRQLHVPGAGEVEGQQLGQIQPVERRQVGAVVLDGATHQGLRQEQHRDDREDPDRGALRGGQSHLAGLAERQRGCLRAVPPDLLAPPPVHGEHDAGPAQQRDQRQHRPHHDRCGGPIVDPRLGRPVVGVAVTVTRALGGGRPRRPREKRGEVMDVGRAGDHVRQQPVLGGVLAEVIRVMLLEMVEGGRLLIGEHQRLGVGVVAVGAKLGHHPFLRVSSPLCPPLRGHIVGRHAQIFRGVVGTEVSAMPQHRPVLHQAARLIELLAAGDLGAAEQHLARLTNNVGRQRH